MEVASMDTQVRAALEAVRDSFAEVRGTDEVKRCAEVALRSSAPPAKIVEIVREGLEIVGERYEAQTYFLSDLIMAGIMAEQVMALLRPHASASLETLGRVVIGTVQGDIHDIGKNLVSTMLIAGGFGIVDIGVDVPVENFVEAWRKNDPKILAMSCLLTIAMDEMRRVVQTFVEVGLRRNVKILIGGRPTTEQFAKEMGADGYGANAVDALKVARDLLI